MVLILYAAVSILWSPFKLSGVKMVAYLAAWFMLYLVLQLSWRHKILDERVVIVALWGSLVLACIQTYIFGNPEQAGSHQFTSFTAAGSFAAFLDSLLALLLFSKGRSLLRGVSCAACALGIIVAGDRTALIGAGFLLVTWFLYRGMAVGTKAGVRFLPAMRTLTVCVVIIYGLPNLHGLGDARKPVE